jgi:hypothetical protein
MRINKPGIYRGVASVHYHSDPCPEPSISQSLCKVIIEHSAGHAFNAHPRLHPTMGEDDDPKFDVGNAAHRIILGRGKEFEILPFDDWRKGDAKKARAEAAAFGKIGILQKQFDRALDMSERAYHQLKNHQDSDAFMDGDAEVMIAWEEDGIWFRSLIDWLHTDLRTVDDYKSSDMSMAPHVLGVRAERAGWHIQHAFIERGLNILDPENAGRRKFRNIAQEAFDPHALTVMHMDEHWLTMGRKQVETAVSIWKTCIRTGQWPSYTNRSIVPVFPGYKEAQWLDREMSGEFDTKLIMAG